LIALRVHCIREDACRNTPPWIRKAIDLRGELGTPEIRHKPENGKRSGLR